MSGIAIDCPTIPGRVATFATCSGAWSCLMSLSRDARFMAIPSLEIENHAVRRAKHSSSVSQIDEKQVYYLMTRGIEEREARKLIVMGFLEPVVERIPLESVAEKLRGLFERKWAG